MSLKVLAFDTATSSCAITIWQNHQILAEEQQFIDRGHAEVLVPLIETVLIQANLSYQELDLLAVTTGPGAFTGIRIGLATARSLAVVCNLPLIGITNFEALVNATPKPERLGCKILVVLETKRSDFYICMYDENLSVLVEPQTIDGSGLGLLVQKGTLLLTGDAIERALPFLRVPGLRVVKSTSEYYVNTGIVAELAAGIMGSGLVLEKPLPFYLKPPDVNLPSTLKIFRAFKK